MSTIIDSLAFPNLVDSLREFGWAETRSVGDHFDFDAIISHGYACCPFSRRILSEFGGLTLEDERINHGYRPPQPSFWERWTLGSPSFKKHQLTRCISFTSASILNAASPSNVLYAASYAVGSVLCPVATFCGVDILICTDMASRLYMHDSQTDSVLRFSGFNELLHGFFSKSLRDEVVEEFKSSLAPEEFEWNSDELRRDGLEIRS